METKRRKHNFDYWYQKCTTQSISIPYKLKNPTCTLLRLTSTSFYCPGQLKPYKDEHNKLFPIDNLGELVPAINRHLKICEGGVAYKTYFGQETNIPARIPSGMSLFQQPKHLTQDLIEKTLHDLDELFHNPFHKSNKSIFMMPQNRGPTNTILFYARKGKQPTFEESLKILYNITPNLCQYILIYHNIVKNILKIDLDEMKKVNMSIVHYDSRAGLNPHVDTVHIFDNTLGPIFTVAIGNSLKMLDLLPVLLPNEKAKRLYSKPNQIMVMDGESRILWAHAKPWGYMPEQFTLVFKFPALSNPSKVTNFEFENVQINIPTYV